MIREDPRSRQVALARSAICDAIDQIAAEHNLTTVETLQGVTEWQARALKYALRTERHGDADTPADVSAPRRRTRAR